jgi:hypothetical protein
VLLDASRSLCFILITSTAEEEWNYVSVLVDLRPV